MIFQFFQLMSFALHSQLSRVCNLNKNFHQMNEKKLFFIYSPQMFWQMIYGFWVRNKLFGLQLNIWIIATILSTGLKSIRFLTLFHDCHHCEYHFGRAYLWSQCTRCSVNHSLDSDLQIFGVFECFTPSSAITSESEFDAFLDFKIDCFTKYFVCFLQMSYFLKNKSQDLLKW